jgi:hypothetical protein
MNWFNSTNAKEIGTLYLIFSVFAGIGTAFSVLTKLVLILTGVNQLFLFLFLLFCVLAVYSFAGQWSLVFFVHPFLKNIFTTLLNKGIKIQMATINFLKQLTLEQLIRYFYYTLFIYIMVSAILALVGMCVSLVDCLYVLPYGSEDSLLHLKKGTPDNYGFIGNPGGSTGGTPGGGTPGGGNPGGFPPAIPGDPNSTHHTTVQIIHEDGSWSSGIRNLFIYGTGGARM